MFDRGWRVESVTVSAIFQDLFLPSWDSPMKRYGAQYDLALKERKWHSEGKVTASKTSASFNSFDDPLLLKIFSYLPLADVVRVSGVCRRWYAVWYDVALWRKADLRCFSKLLGDEVAFERFAWSRLSTKAHDVDLTGLVLTAKNLNTIAVHCKNLRRLTLRCVTFKDEGDPSRVDDTLLVPEKLERLDISFSWGSPSIFSRISSQLHGIKSLGACDGLLLALTASAATLESSVSNLAGSLEKLALNQCLMVNDSLLEAFARCDKLKVLSLRKCNSVFGKSLPMLLKRCPCLETLILDGTSIESGVLETVMWEGSLLKHLELGWCPLVSAQSLKTTLPRIAQIPSLLYLGLCNIGQGKALSNEVFQSFVMNLRNRCDGPVRVHVSSSSENIDRRLTQNVPKQGTLCEVPARKSCDSCAAASVLTARYSFTSQFPVPEYELETSLWESSPQWGRRSRNESYLHSVHATRAS